MQWKNRLKRPLAAMLSLVLFLSLFPASAMASAVSSKNTLDGWTVNAAWSTRSADYTWNASNAETRQPKIYVTYRIEDAPRDYPAGSLHFQIPGISGVLRAKITKATDIAADADDSEWSYVWDSDKDVYTFTNKFDMKAGDATSGGFELLWTIDARSATNDYSTSGTPVFTIDNIGSIELTPLSYQFTSQRDRYRIDLTAKTVSAIAYDTLDRSYTWYNVNTRFEYDRMARGLYRSSYWIWFDIPSGVNPNDISILSSTGTAIPITQNESGQYGFYLFQNKSGDILTPQKPNLDQYVHIGFPKEQTSGKTITIHSRLDRLYQDDTQWISTAGQYEKVEDAVSVRVQPYSLDYTGYVYSTGVAGPWKYQEEQSSVYSNRMNSTGLYNNAVVQFSMIGRANRGYASPAAVSTFSAFSLPYAADVPMAIDDRAYGLGEDDEYSLQLGSDQLAITTLDGGTRNLLDSEYDVAYVTMSSASVSGKTWSLYAAKSQDTPFDQYELITSGVTGTYQTVTLPSGYKAFYVQVDELVGSFYYYVYAGIRFHIDYEQCLLDGTLPDNEGHLTMFNLLRAPYTRGNITYNDVSVSINSYKGDYALQLANRDKNLHNEYLFRTMGDVYLREPVLNMDTQITTTGFETNTEVMPSIVTVENEISADDPGDLTNFSTYVVIPDAVQFDYDTPVSITGRVTDISGQTVTDFESRATMQITQDLAGRKILKIDFDFSDQPLEMSKTVKFKISFGVLLRYADFVVNGSTYTFQSYLFVNQSGLAKIAGTDIVSDVYDVNGDGNTSQLMAHSDRPEIVLDKATEWREHANKYVNGAYTTGYIYETAVQLRDNSVDLADQPGAAYSYRLDYGVGADSAKNIVFYDRLEQAEDSQWQGTLLSVDTSGITNLGGIPTVYYSTDPNQEFDLSAPGWTTSPTDMAAVRAVAVHMDTSEMSDGALIRGLPAYVILNMSAPSNEAFLDKTAVNQYTVTYDAYDIFGVFTRPYQLDSNLTSVVLRENVATLILQKADADNITKYDKDGNPQYAALYGGEFAVYPSMTSNKPIWQGSLNAMGRIIIEDLNHGTYYYEEITAPQGYVKLEGRHPIELNTLTDNKAQYILNNRIPGTVKLSKDDANFDGYGPVPGAVFELYTVSGDPVLCDNNNAYDPNGTVSQFTTGPDGTLTITNLPWGAYYFTEINPPDGYHNNADHISFTINAQNYDLNISAKDQEKTASILLSKTDSADGAPVSGAVFDLYRVARGTETSDVRVKTGLMTNAMGEIEVTGLLFGEYYFIETRNAPGYRMPDADHAKTGTVTLDASTVEQVLEIKFTNDRRAAQVNLYKTDDFDYPVAGAEYALYLKHDGVDDELIGTYPTDEEGMFIVTGLDWGSYYFLEQSAPEGWEVSDEKTEFEINRQNVENIIYIDVQDSRLTGTVCITKVDKDDPSITLAGAEFDLYASDGTKLVPGVDYTTDMPDNQIVTCGTGTVTISGLKQRGYYLQETKSPEGYSLDSKYIRFSVTLGTAAITQHLVVENARGQATIKINKTVDDIHSGFGSQTFLFKIQSQQTGKSYTKSIILSEGQTSGSVAVTVNANETYVIYECGTPRYELAGITPVSNITDINLANCSAVASMVGNIYSEVTFTNSLDKYDMLSHSDNITNIVTTGPKLTGISVDYHGPNPISEDSLGGRVYIELDLDGGTLIPDGAWAANGETSAISNPAIYRLPAGTEVKLPENKPVRTGYEFLGYTISGTDHWIIPETTSTITVNENITLTAMWQKAYTVKYAVRLYGIYDDLDEYGMPTGLTFGPSGGYDKQKGIMTQGLKYTYVCHDENDPICIHNMTWEQIIEQSKIDPSAFYTCLENGCTHSVELVMEGPIAGRSFENQMNNGDGASALYYSISTNYSAWNSVSATLGGWGFSKIRNTLNGVPTPNTINPLNSTNCLLAMFPSILQENIIPKAVSYKTLMPDGMEEISITWDKLWLFSPSEMYMGGYKYDDPNIFTTDGSVHMSQMLMNALSTETFERTTTVNRFYNENNVADYVLSRTQYDNNNVINFTSNGYPHFIQANTTGYSIAPGFCLPGPNQN